MYVCMCMRTCVCVYVRMYNLCKYRHKTPPRSHNLLQHCVRVCVCVYTCAADQQVLTQPHLLLGASNLELGPEEIVRDTIKE